MEYRCTSVKEGEPQYKVIIKYYNNGEPSSNTELDTHKHWMYQSGPFELITGNVWIDLISHSDLNNTWVPDLECDDQEKSGLPENHHDRYIYLANKEMRNIFITVFFAITLLAVAGALMSDVIDKENHNSETSTQNKGGSDE